MWSDIFNLGKSLYKLSHIFPPFRIAKMAKNAERSLWSTQPLLLFLEPYDWTGWHTLTRALALTITGNFAGTLQRISPVYSNKLAFRYAYCSFPLFPFFVLVASLLMASPQLARIPSTKPAKRKASSRPSVVFLGKRKRGGSAHLGASLPRWVSENTGNGWCSIYLLRVKLNIMYNLWPLQPPHPPMTWVQPIH